MRTYVINLERRPDRRAFMQRQADRLELELEFVDAVDARRLGSTQDAARRVPRLSSITDGDFACALSHRKVWQLILDRGERFATVLEDDAVLSDDAKDFVGDDRWIPTGARIIKLERYGRRSRKIAMDRDVTEVAGHIVGRFHSKNLGTAGYVVSLDAARLLLERTQHVDDAIDQMLFNPGRSALFSLLRPMLLEPAVCQQAPGEVSSDIRASRSPTWRSKLAAGVREMGSLPRHLAHYPLLILPLVLRRIVWRSTEFRPPLAAAVASELSQTPAGAGRG